MTDSQSELDIGVIQKVIKVLAGLTTPKTPETRTVIKAFDAEQQISVEIIAEHSKLDAHNQWYSEETLVKGCANFNINLESGNVTPNLFHLRDESEKLEIIKTYIIPIDCTIGETVVVKGTWVGEVKWKDDNLWAKRTVPQADGTLEISGVSIGAKGVILKPNKATT